MKTVYFVRHAEPNYENHVDRDRELTAKGWADARLVEKFLRDKSVSQVYSSPYRRSIETVRGFAEAGGYEIQLVEDFRERKVGDDWIEDFNSFAKKQWEDFHYHLKNGECLFDVQTRNIRALEKVLGQEGDRKSIVIGSHGTALSTVIQYYQPGFGYAEFVRLAKMPWIVEFGFEDDACRKIVSHDLFSGAVEILFS